LLVIVTTGVGIWFGSQGSADLGKVMWTLVGTALTVGSANAFNHYWERLTDAKMERTRDRPLPSGRLRPWQVLIFGGVTGIGGLLILWQFINGLTAILAMVAIFSYVPLYTMLKPITSLSTIVGAIPGAIPPVIGWTAVRGTIEFPAVILFSMLFLWQPPHFIALALYLKEDYRKAGLAMLPVEMNERASMRQLIVYTAALFLVSFLPVLTNMAGYVYLVVASLSGVIYLGMCLIAFTLRKGNDERWTKGLFLYSIAYLPMVMVAMVIDRMGGFL